MRSDRTEKEASMQTLVIYDSKFGNTEKVAEALRNVPKLG